MMTLFDPALELSTDRLILRPMSSADVEPHIAMMQDERTAAFLTEEGKPRDRATEWRAAATLLGHWHIRGFGFFSVFEKATGQWIGRVGPWQPEGWPGLEVGWSIAPDLWGKGYAPEAALATMKWTFDKFPDLPRLISVIDPENANSQVVARKVGETKSGEIFKLWAFTLDIWSVSREDWLARFDTA